MPAAVIAAIVGAGATAATGIVGAKMQSSAAKSGAQISADASTHAADLQAKAAADAATIAQKAAADQLNYTKQQDALSRKDAETTRRANYDQWAAQMQARNTIADMLGTAHLPVAPYVPMSMSDTPSGTHGTATKAAAGSGAGLGDSEAYFNSLFPGDTLTPAQLKAAEAQLGQKGIKVLTNASGVAGKIQLSDGTIVDVIQGAGSGVNKKQFLTGGGTSTATAKTGSGLPADSLGSFMTAPSPTRFAVQPRRAPYSLGTMMSGGY